MTNIHVQMVDPDFHHRANDPGVDIPGLPHADYRSPCRHPER